MPDKKIVLACTKKYNSINPNYLEKLMCQYFEFRPYRLGEIEFDAVLLCEPFDTDDVITAAESGKKIIVDNLQESVLPKLSSLTPYQQNVLLMTGGSADSHPNFRVHNVFEWFWYFEAPWYHLRGYDRYVPDRNIAKKRFLMPIRRQNLARDLACIKMKQWLDESLHSYVGRGKNLPVTSQDGDEDQRWFSPSWYDSTYFTVVNETNVYENEPRFWTEKTCKPLAFYHPFLVISNTGLLPLIRSYGFETFPEVFDESYDVVSDYGNRLDQIITQIREFDPRSLDHPVVQEKLKHNHAHFFDLDLIFHRLKEKVIDVLIEFVSTKA
jgi:hypothetical protein